ncbi:STAS domain-containing protein [Blastococcus sp. TML/M2B]|uniref:STAS domain-containing protein n=1 Tax=unclassified Blastococcus TaxID=2619396 RepID=UPI00190C52BF|nr:MULTISPECIES: STAS domain-containing protein [unclassified Blastococcus]MBN1093305.1 STAS domain-containing protein [Blastococcus sp. TML/M2B]MBN1096582.1 STAS domain-containing protein [Blastococcus sp. TML/C7B]
MLFDVEPATVAGRPALTVRGELDLSTAPRLEAAADESMVRSPEFVIDLTHTTFLDSSGARTLLGIARKAGTAGVRLHVVAPRSNGPVRLTIDLLDLGAYVPLVSSPGEIRATIADRDAGA